MASKEPLQQPLNLSIADSAAHRGSSMMPTDRENCKSGWLKKIPNQERRLSVMTPFSKVSIKNIIEIVRNFLHFVRSRRRLKKLGYHFAFTTILNHCWSFTKIDGQPSDIIPCRRRVSKSAYTCLHRSEFTGITSTYLPSRYQVKL